MGGLTQTPADPGWLESERWVWQELLQGREADFNSAHGLLDPKQADGWTEAREVRPGFLKSILLSDPYRSALPATGVRVYGAWVRATLSLDGTRLAHGFRLQKCRIDSDVSLIRVRCADDLSFRGSAIQGNCTLVDTRIEGSLDFSALTTMGDIDLRRANVADSLFFGESRCRDVNLLSARIGANAYLRSFDGNALTLTNARLGGVLYLGEAHLRVIDLKRAVIGGHADLSNAHCAGVADLEGIEVGSDLFFTDARLASLSINGATIAGQLTLSGTHCSGPLNLEGIDVGSDLILNGGQLHALELNGAITGGQLCMDETVCEGEISMQGAHVGTDLMMNRAEFREAVDMQGSSIGTDVVANGATFGAAVDLSHLVVALSLRMSDIKASGAIDLNNARINGDLRLRSAALARNLSLVGAVIGQTLRMDGTECAGTLLLDGMRCVDINLSKARLQQVQARAVSVASTVNLSGTKVIGAIDLELAKIGGNLFLRDDETAPGEQGHGEFGELKLIDTQVAGTIETRKARFDGKFDLSSARAAYLWLLPGSWFREPVVATHVHVEQNVEMGGARFDDKVDLSGAEIRSMLILSSTERGPPRWEGKSHLILRDVSVRTVRLAETGNDRAAEAWPREVRLDGFTYQRIGETPDDARGAVGSVIREGEWLVAWLASDPRYSPQPYQQLARVLTEQGDTRRADEILFAGRNRQRREAKGVRRVLDTLLWITIGYGIGYRYFFSLAWVALLMLVGSRVFGPAVRAKWPEPGMALLFSLDQLLPVVGIAPGADDIAKALKGAAHWYLAIHRALGFLLGSFVIAGLSGITKK